MKLHSTLRAVIALIALVASGAHADELAHGEVRRIDLAQGKITLRHGPIVNLDMPPMTMVFFVATPELLNQLQIGQQVRFAVEEQVGQKLVITHIEPDR